MQNWRVHGALEGKSANSLKSCTPKYVGTKHMKTFQLKEGVEMEMMNIRTARGNFWQAAREQDEVHLVN